MLRRPKAKTRWKLRSVFSTADAKKHGKRAVFLWRYANVGCKAQKSATPLFSAILKKICGPSGNA